MQTISQVLTLLSAEGAAVSRQAKLSALTSLYLGRETDNKQHISKLHSLWEISAVEKN